VVAAFVYPNMPRPPRTGSSSPPARYFTRSSLGARSGKQRVTYTEDDLRYKLLAEHTTGTSTSTSTTLPANVAEGKGTAAKASATGAAAAAWVPAARGTSTVRHASRVRRTASEGGVTVRKNDRPRRQARTWTRGTEGDAEDKSRSLDQQDKRPSKRSKMGEGGSAVLAKDNSGDAETTTVRGGRPTDCDEGILLGAEDEEERSVAQPKRRRTVSGNGSEAPQGLVPSKTVRFYPQLELDGHSVGVPDPGSDYDSDLSLPHSTSFRSDNGPPQGSSLATTASLRRTNLLLPPDASPLPPLSPEQGRLIKTPGLSEVRMTVYHPPRAPLSVLPPNALLALLSSGRGAASRATSDGIARPESDQSNSPSQYLDPAGPRTGLAREQVGNLARLSPSRSFQQVLAVPIEGPGGGQLLPPSLLLDKRRSPLDVTPKPPLDSVPRLLLIAGTLVELAAPQLVDVSPNRHLGGRTLPPQRFQCSYRTSHICGQSNRC
jgi:hypothetical protein